jgi:predicted adenylyl cyclase CyaB
MPSFEIEIKSLIGSKENAEELVKKMQTKDTALQSLGSHKQLNHYFVDGSLENLSQKIADKLSDDKKKELENLVAHARDFSVRTRLADGKVILVVKVTVDDTTSFNGTARQEFENQFADLSFEQLDQIVLDAGFKYQAKWSREREDYKFKDLNVSIDKNAGYGYLAEFESVVDDASKADEVKAKIREIMKDLGAEELNQDRLARMFDFYNKNWQDYYGTDKVFNIE